MLRNSYLTSKQTIKSKYLNDYILDLNQQNFTYPDSYYYKVIEVTEDQIARPDIISKDLYDDDQYGDLICKINNISNPFELNVGDKLIVPTADYVEGFYAEDLYYEEDYISTTKPAAKTKKEKRKPNEAIVGDTRFKIDSSKRVVIY